MTREAAETKARSNAVPGNDLVREPEFLTKESKDMNTCKLWPHALLATLTLTACGEKSPAGSTTPAPVVVAPAAPSPASPPPAPAGVVAKGPAARTEDLAKGEKIYAATCVVCHGAGVLGAPKFGDKAVWQPRIAKGMEVLYANSIKGINTMPPKGGNAALKDDELKLAVDYMISKAN